MEDVVSMETRPVEKERIIGRGMGGAYVNNSAYFFLHRNPTLIALHVAMGEKRSFHKCVCVYFIHFLGRKSFPVYTWKFLDDCQVQEFSLKMLCTCAKVLPSVKHWFHIWGKVQSKTRTVPLFLFSMMPNWPKSTLQSQSYLAILRWVHDFFFLLLSISPQGLCTFLADSNTLAWLNLQTQL